MIDQFTAASILGFIHDPLAECVELGIKKYQEKVQPLYAQPTRRLRAIAIRDLVIEAVRIAFDETEGVKIYDDPVHQRVALVVQEKVVLRFKKLDERFRPRTFPTRTAVRFDDQLPLPRVPAGDRLTVGYQLNHDETELDGVFIVCSLRNRKMWAYPIGRTAAKVTQLPLPLTYPATGLRVVPKADAKKRTAKESGS